GIKTPEQAAEVANLSDGAVVGSAIVDIIANNLSEDGSGNDEIVRKVAAFVSDLANAVNGK
ncbi:MAG: tryptophan synthase subunit alpha, partial [Candidatus Puniceispirillum sp.]